MATATCCETATADFPSPSDAAVSLLQPTPSTVGGGALLFDKNPSNNNEPQDDDDASSSFSQRLEDDDDTGGGAIRYYTSDQLLSGAVDMVRSSVMQESRTVVLLHADDFENVSLTSTAVSSLSWSSPPTTEEDENPTSTHRKNAAPETTQVAATPDSSVKETAAAAALRIQCFARCAGAKRTSTTLRRDSEEHAAAQALREATAKEEDDLPLLKLENVTAQTRAVVKRNNNLFSSFARNLSSHNGKKSTPARNTAASTQSPEPSPGGGRRSQMVKKQNSTWRLFGGETTPEKPTIAEEAGNSDSGDLQLSEPRVASEDKAEVDAAKSPAAKSPVQRSPLVKKQSTWRLFGGGGSTSSDKSETVVAESSIEPAAASPVVSPREALVKKPSTWRLFGGKSKDDDDSPALSPSLEHPAEDGDEASTPPITPKKIAEEPSGDADAAITAAIADPVNLACSYTDTEEDMSSSSALFSPLGDPSKIMRKNPMLASIFRLDESTTEEPSSFVVPSSEAFVMQQNDSSGSGAKPQIASKSPLKELIRSEKSLLDHDTERDADEQLKEQSISAKGMTETAEPANHCLSPVPHTAKPSVFGMIDACRTPVSGQRTSATACSDSDEQLDPSELTQLVNVTAMTRQHIHEQSPTPAGMRLGSIHLGSFFGNGGSSKGVESASVKRQNVASREKTDLAEEERDPCSDVPSGYASRSDSTLIVKAPQIKASEMPCPFDVLDEPATTEFSPSGREDNKQSTSEPEIKALVNVTAKTRQVVKKEVVRQHSWSYFADMFGSDSSTDSAGANGRKRRGRRKPPRKQRSSPLAGSQDLDLMSGRQRLRLGKMPMIIRGKVWSVLGSVADQMREHPGLYRYLVLQSVTATTTASSSTALCRKSFATFQRQRQQQQKPSDISTHFASKGGPASDAADEEQSDMPRRSASRRYSLSTEKPTAEIQQQHMAKRANCYQHHLERSFHTFQETIEKDIHRTFPQHALFAVQPGQPTKPGSVSTRAQTCLSVAMPTTSLSRSQSSAMFTIRHAGAGPAPLPSVQGISGVGADEKEKQNKITNEALNSQGGAASLRRVLKAYSLYDQEVGYCQGMNFIAGLFLTLMPEEEAFWMLVYVMSPSRRDRCGSSACNNKNMRDLFKEGMRGTQQVLHVAEKLLQQYLPELARHLDDQYIHVSMFATRWLLTHYASCFHFDLALRVWDCFLLEGWEMSYSVMLAILRHWESTLLKMSFEQLMHFFQDLPDLTDVPVILDLAVKRPVQRKDIAHYEKDFLAQQEQRRQKESK